jgi:hypothetical protein
MHIEKKMKAKEKKRHMKSTSSGKSGIDTRK